MLLENIPIGLGLRGIRSCTSHPSGVHIKRVDQSCPSPRKSTKMNIIAERTGSVLYVTRCAQIHPARGDFHHIFASKDIVAILSAQVTHPIPVNVVPLDPVHELIFTATHARGAPEL